ncbi:hypothetical protein KEM48_002187 [Puccinia striiformis f. sp. tritici PST-130]|nr:hypothetical protein KEM48_002187 [Puccinia striiformis f. sp. tritici PST-130]
MTSRNLVDQQFLFTEQRQIRPKIDTLESCGLFHVTNTSDDSMLSALGDKELLTWGTIDEEQVNLEESDHRDVRLFYKFGYIRNLIYGEVYWLAGTVLGNRYLEMPFLDCEVEGAEARATGFMNHEGTTVSGVGMIKKIAYRQGPGERSEVVVIYVKHQVDSYTAFGDKNLWVKYNIVQGSFPDVLEKLLEWVTVSSKNTAMTGASRLTFSKLRAAIIGKDA